MLIVMRVLVLFPRGTFPDFPLIEELEDPMVTCRLDTERYECR